MSRAWINDGLTLEADIAPEGEKDAPYPPVKIKFRPPLPSVLLKYEEMDSLRGPERVDALIAYLKAHLVEWDVQDHNDKVPPINEVSLMHVPPPYLFKMRNKISESVQELATARKN